MACKMQLYHCESNHCLYPCLLNCAFCKNCSSNVNPIIVIPVSSSFLLNAPSLPALCVIVHVLLLKTVIFVSPRWDFKQIQGMVNPRRLINRDPNPLKEPSLHCFPLTLLKDKMGTELITDLLLYFMPQLFQPLTIIEYATGHQNDTT